MLFPGPGPGFSFTDTVPHRRITGRSGWCRSSKA